MSEVQFTPNSLIKSGNTSETEEDISSNGTNSDVESVSSISSMESAETHSSEDSYHVFSTLGNILVWPFVKIYELFISVFKAICCGCCKSNVIDRFMTDPESLIREFRKNPTSVVKELVDLLLNDPQKVEKSIKEFVGSEEAIRVFSDAYLQAVKAIAIEQGKDQEDENILYLLEGEIFGQAVVMCLIAGTEYEELNKFRLDNKELNSDEVERMLEEKFGKEKLKAEEAFGEEMFEAGHLERLKSNLCNLIESILGTLNQLLDKTQLKHEAEKILTDLSYLDTDEARIQFYGMKDFFTFLKTPEGRKALNLAREGLKKICIELKTAIKELPFLVLLIEKFEKTLDDETQTQNVIFSLFPLIEVLKKFRKEYLDDSISESDKIESSESDESGLVSDSSFDEEDSEETSSYLTSSNSSSEEEGVEEGQQSSSQEVSSDDE